MTLKTLRLRNCFGKVILNTSEMFFQTFVEIINETFLDIATFIRTGKEKAANNIASVILCLKIGNKTTLKSGDRGMRDVVTAIL